MGQHTFEGIVAPAFTPAAPNLHYTDTVAKKSYTSVGTSTSADWILDNPPAGVSDEVDAQIVHAKREFGAGTKSLPSFTGPDTDEDPAGFVGGSFHGDSTVNVTHKNPDSGFDLGGALLTLVNCKSNSSSTANALNDGKSVMTGNIRSSGTGSVGTAENSYSSTSCLMNFYIDSSISKETKITDSGTANIINGHFSENSYLESTNASSGCIINARMKNESLLKVTGDGCLATGYLDGAIAGRLATMYAYGSGNIVFGKSKQTTSANKSILKVSGKGNFSGGYAKASGDQAQIYCSGSGNHAGGYAKATAAPADITASGKGSFAHGYVADGTISATANNAVQFGVGANAQADSLQIGNAGIRFKGTTGAAVAPQNGDIFVDNSYVYVRSNGSNVKIL